MSTEPLKFEFKKDPKIITYLDGKSLNLTNQFVFYHNKNRFRKDLTRLQNLFNDKVNVPLLASGIRDSYIKEEYSDNYLITIFTTKLKIKESNQMFESMQYKSLEDGCALIYANEEYMILVAKDMIGLVLGIEYIEEILTQILDEYLERKEFDDYIKIRPFKLTACSK
jgi:hypothetical protein